MRANERARHALRYYYHLPDAARILRGPSQRVDDDANERLHVDVPKPRAENREGVRVRGSTSAEVRVGDGPEADSQLAPGK